MKRDIKIMEFGETETIDRILLEATEPVLVISVSTKLIRKITNDGVKNIDIHLNNETILSEPFQYSKHDQTSDKKQDFTSSSHLRLEIGDTISTQISNIDSPSSSLLMVDIHYAKISDFGEFGELAATYYNGIHYHY